jgi:LytS/YehU family sensor histidine kinase
MSSLRSAFAVIAASLVLAVLQTACVSVVYLFARIPGAFTSWTWFPAALATWTVTFLLWNAIYTAIHYFRRNRRAELDNLQLEIVARDAELRALHGQINPHFLFNSLNSLRALIHEDPGRADRAVTELAGVLRYALQSGKSSTVPVQAELEAVASYLALEAIRFEERLHVKIDVPTHLRTIPIPPMLMQTLVENAIRHGIERRNGPGEIRISFSLREDGVCLEVRNTGEIPAVSNGNRIGLANARERMRLLFGEDSRLELREEDGQVIAAASWPANRPSEAAIAGTDRR